MTPADADFPPSELSRLLWDAREHLDMAGDIVDIRGGPAAAAAYYEIRDRLDAYRETKGWNPHGFGGEDER